MWVENLRTGPLDGRKGGDVGEEAKVGETR